MTKWTPNKIEIISFVIMFIAIVISLFEMIGKPAQLAILLTLMFSSIGVGASFGSYIQKRRKISDGNKKKVIRRPNQALLPEGSATERRMQEKRKHGG